MVVRVVRGEQLALHAMMYLGSNRISPSFSLSARAPVAIVVGKPTDVLVQFLPNPYPVWVALRPQRAIVNAHDGPGQITIATDGCALRATVACDTRPLYAPTASPIGAAPSGGVVTDQGFTLHVATAAVQPGRYDTTFETRYPPSGSHPSVLDVTDTLHVRLDIDSHGPPSMRCTLADLHRAGAPMPIPHASPTRSS